MTASSTNSSSKHLSAAEKFRLLPARVREQRLTKLTPEEKLSLFYKWEFWARPNQLLPAGEWTTWMIMAGRGFGKTRTGAEAVRRWVRTNRLVNIIAPTSDDARDVCIEGESGILAICPPDERPIYKASKRLLLWPNGARSLIFTADEPERLRGKQHMKLWCFTAGTSVLSQAGSVPIETLRRGDRVWTREGLQFIEFTGARTAEVGKVFFSDGSFLIGTFDHPVLTSVGWTMLGCLAKGQTAFAGNVCRAAISRAMKDRGKFISTVRSGSQRTARSRQGCTSIIETGIDPTTNYPISNWSRQGITSAANPKRPPLSLRSFANHAERTSSAVEETNGSDAAVVAIDSPMIGGADHGAARIAGDPLVRSVEISAVSVASIWEPAGTATVHNLKVRNIPEFFANGILVHNCDELAAWRFDASWDQARFGLRLGNFPQAIVTTTPKPIKIVKEILKESSTFLTRGTTYENRSNLASAFYSHIITKYEGTRLGRQELNAELLEDRPGALWTHALIDQHRVQKMPALVKMGIALDPATTSTETSDEWGIVGAGKDDRNPPHFYVFCDESEILTPNAAGQRAIRLYKEWELDRIIGETNQGGDMIESILRLLGFRYKYKGVHASRGKFTRAEPISSLYEQGRVHHVGTFAPLEDEMCDYDPDVTDPSPNRMDALVWVLTWLSSGGDARGLHDAYEILKKRTQDQEAGKMPEKKEPSKRTRLAKPVESTLEKPVTVPETSGCPDCHATCITTVAGGQKRCGNCGKQWGDARTAVSLPKRSPMRK